MARAIHHCEECGTETIVWGANRAEADRKLRWHQENRALCTSCRRARETREARQKAVELQLPDLVGTQAQVDYAEALRIGVVVHLLAADKEDEISYLRSDDIRTIRDADRAQYEAAVSELIGERSAHVWIEAKDTMLMYRLRAIIKRKAMETVPLGTGVLEAAVEFEAILRPEKAVSETVAEFSVEAAMVAISFPERHDDFRTAVKAMGFGWSEAKRWERAITGSLIAITAETARHLLANGFVVKILDNEARAAATTGNFEVEAGKQVDVAGKNKMRIDWRRIDGDYYAAVKKLPGAVWSKAKQTVLVPVTSADEIRDFSDRAGFTLTPAALDAFQKFDAFRADGMVVSGSKKGQSEFVLDMSRPAADTIDEELLDN